MSRPTATAPVPFEEVLRPWLAEVYQQVVWPGWVADPARAALERHLASTVSRVATPALMARFEAERAGGYRSFVERYDDARVAGELTVLAELADTLGRAWVEAMTELVGRAERGLACRWPAGARLVEVRCGLGDRHHGGRQVTALVPDHGPTVVYKPRSLANEIVFHDLAESIGVLSPGDRPWVDDHGDHGFMAHVAAQPVDDPDRYWFEVGRFLRLVQLTGTVDLHQSNVISVAAGLVAVDLECLAAPDLVARGHEELRHDGGIMRDSVMRSGLLPRSASQAGPIAVEWAGLFGEGGHVNGGWRPTVVDPGTDRMRMSRTPLRTPRASNRARDRSGQVLPVLVDRLRAGYEQAYDAIGETEVVGRLTGLRSRALLRSTAVYAHRIAGVATPEAMADREVFDAVIGDLPELGGSFVDLLGPDGVEAVVRSEVQALRVLDVPVAWACGADLELDDGTVLRDRIQRPGVDRVRDRFARSSPSLRRIESGTIAILAEPVAGRDGTDDRNVSGDLPESMVGLGGSAGSPPAALVERALDLADQVASDGVSRPDGRLVWLEPSPSGVGGALWPVVGAADLYSGSAGIAVALAAAAAAGRAPLADAALKALPGSGAGEAPPWLQSGWSGRLWAQAMVGALLDRQDLVDAAARELVDLLPHELDPGESLDLIGGWAGVVAAASSIARHDGQDRTIAAVAEFARRVGELAEIHLGDPYRARPLERLSMAHGSFGLSHALGAAAHLTGDDRLRRRFSALVEREEQRIGARDGVAARLDQAGRRRVPSRTWCWGVAGHLLNRMQPWHDDSRGAMAAVRVSVDLLAGDTAPLAHACCGLAGHLEALAATAAATGSTDAAAARDRVVERLVGDEDMRFHRSTSYQGASLFRGRSGVVTALLRAARPDVEISALDLH